MPAHEFFEIETRESQVSLGDSSTLNWRGGKRRCCWVQVGLSIGVVAACSSRRELGYRLIHPSESLRR